MPVMKCANGKWKLGKNGKCSYTSKKKAEKAQVAYHAQQNETVNEEYKQEQLLQQELDRMKEIAGLSKGA